MKTRSLLIYLALIYLPNSFSYFIDYDLANNLSYDQKISQKDSNDYSFRNDKEFFNKLPLEIWTDIYKYLEPDDIALRFITKDLDLRDTDIQELAISYLSTGKKNIVKFYSHLSDKNFNTLATYLRSIDNILSAIDEQIKTGNTLELSISAESLESIILAGYKNHSNYTGNLKKEKEFAISLFKNIEKHIQLLKTKNKTTENFKALWIPVFAAFSLYSTILFRDYHEISLIRPYYPLIYESLFNKLIYNDFLLYMLTIVLTIEFFLWLETIESNSPHNFSLNLSQAIIQNKIIDLSDPSA